jgi:hypothetical protein
LIRKTNFKIGEYYFFADRNQIKKNIPKSFPKPLTHFNGKSLRKNPRVTNKNTLIKSAKGVIIF